MTIDGLSPQTARLEHVRVVVDALFPEEHEVLRVSDPRVGATETGTLCAFEITAVTSDSLRVVCRPASTAPSYPLEALPRLVDAAFLAVSGPEEELATVESFQPAGAGVVVYRLHWTRMTTERIAELRIRVARSLWLRSTPLDVRDLPIP